MNFFCKMESTFVVVILFSLNLFPSTLCQFAPTNFQRQKLNNYDTRFVAASRGDPPPCDVKPGETYCETLKHYPYDMIIDAIRNSKIDVSRLLVDESYDNAPNFGFVKTGSKVVTEKILPDANFFESLRRNQRSNSANQTLLSRDTRQSTNGMSIPTCKYTTRYIYPQAAMCVSTREWMYVVNLREFGVDKFSQLIKTEVCDADAVGKPCMGDYISSNLPFATTSVCEQHYLQKRLIAISTKDTTIVSEMFWLPTCCICRTFRILL
ncbi:unnamed protein product [Ceutorhynchus assimilis]|uniref:Spaetzle domain-containing protein n=1 Tax=Ceutorhynchus assimilis TaxID=467358 RepID=A0A9N9MND4_9CUCU|nr:unnamed protein product [Ceutorhynchus assimilis]